MFRAQIPPKPLDYAVANFIQILEDRFGRAAALEAQTRQYLALLHEEMGHPITVLTRRSFDRCAERALQRFLAAKQ